MSYKVFNLQCESGHLFEGWFASHDDYDDQTSRGLLACPMCQSASIQKMPSAPRLNFGKAVAPSAAATSTANASVTQNEQFQRQAIALQQMRALITATENVGPRFADEARRIHEGEADQRAIRGTATHQERAELIEEGIAVVALPEFLTGEQLQ
jgi:hypothetical protein